MAKAPKRAVIYARISQSTDESVSIAQQIEEATEHIAREGWQLVGEPFVDEGVSASKVPAGDRPGWRRLMAAVAPGTVIVARHFDRIVRSTLDWGKVYEQIKATDTTLCTFAGPKIDLTTAQGKLVADILAAVAEMEASLLSERVRAGRRQVVRQGRSLGGVQPFGWRLVSAPGGGVVQQKHPDECPWVVAIVERTLAGLPVYGTATWLNAQGAPLPSPKSKRWTYLAVNRILRHPVLAGMTPHNPGNGSKLRGNRLRTVRGEPVVEEGLAIMSVREWRSMVADLDARSGGIFTPRTECNTTSPVLAGLMRCARCTGTDGDARPMVRHTTGGREGYKCPICHQTITQFEDLVIAEFLRLRGHEPRFRPGVEIHHDDGRLGELDRYIADLGLELADAKTDADEDRIMAAMQEARIRRREIRESVPEPDVVFEEVGFFADEWDDAGDDTDAQIAVLHDAIDRIVVRPGGRGKKHPHHIDGRVTFHWKVYGGEAEQTMTEYGEPLSTDEERYGTP